MRLCTIFVATLFFAGSSGITQTNLDKTLIYTVVIESLPDKNLPIVDETFLTRIYDYDVDGDFNRWRRKRTPPTQDSSVLDISMTCVIPVKYSETLVNYFSKNKISADIPALVCQAEDLKFDSLRKYVPAKKLISWKKAPLGVSLLNNMFKKRKAIGLSDVLYDEKNHLAFVKKIFFSKNKYREINSSKIFILKKSGAQWSIIDILDQSSSQ